MPARPRRASTGAIGKRVGYHVSMRRVSNNVIRLNNSAPDYETDSETPAKRWIGSPHPVDAELGWFTGVHWHDFASCYVWEDSAVFDSLGEVIGHHRGNTIYIDRASEHDLRDLLHEIGHAVGRHFDLVGHRGNRYAGEWDLRAKRLIGAVSNGRHWSGHLNAYAASVENFAFNAASEIWAELFMLFYLYPGLPETDIIEAEIDKLRRDTSFCRLEAVLSKVLGD